MISRIRGTILDKQAQEVLVDVNGVGYELLVPMTTVFELPDVGKEAVFHTHFVVREDAQLLFGFADTRERELFRVLIRVNGVGPKMALNILSGMASADLVRCVQNNDLISLTRLPGIGRKTAERLLVEIRDKLADWLPEQGSSTEQTHKAAGSDLDQQIKDAESALVSLGYKPQEAAKAVSTAQKGLEQEGKPMASEALIRLALRNMR